MVFRVASDSHRHDDAATRGADTEGRSLGDRRRRHPIISRDMTLALLNGGPASAEDLHPLALGNFGHYTSMQVCDRAVRGLDLHLARLQSATRELFAVELDPVRVRQHTLAALDAAGVDDAGVRVTVFSRSFDPLSPRRVADVDVLTTIRAAGAAAVEPLRLKACAFERAMPHLKHVGIFPQVECRASAMRDGFDDALFVDAAQRVLEGAFWNVGFWHGDVVVWPDGPALRGTGERLLRDQLALAGLAQSIQPVHLDDLHQFDSAFVVNARGVQGISAIDGLTWVDPHTTQLATLRRLLTDVPWDPLRA